MPTTRAPVRLLSGIGELVPAYDGFIFDLWGVVHDGFAPFPGVLDVLERLRETGKKTLFLSNAPRRQAVVAAALTDMGIPPDLYGGIHSSGEETWQALSARSDPWYAALGSACLHLGPERDRNMLDGLDLIEVTTPEAADFILNTGIDRDEETVADYEDLLARGAARGVPMVCANADREALRGKTRVICAGALAQRYEALGGKVRTHGKPDPEIFKHALGLLGIADPRRALVIGDSLDTDIRGAERAHIDAVLVTSGLHAAELALESPHETLPEASVLHALLKRKDRHPVAVIPSLAW